MFVPPCRHEFFVRALRNKGIGSMFQSHVVEHNGVFIGAAVPLPNSQGFRFVATHHRVEEIDGSVWPTLAETKLVAVQLMRTGQLVGRRGKALVNTSVS